MAARRPLGSRFLWLAEDKNLMEETGDALPLARFRVLDLTRVRAGPTAVRQLADWGADVIKVEAPASAGGDGGLGGPRHGPDFQNLHRNKRSLALNLKDPDGLAIFHDLVESADVVLENYRPEVKRRLKVDYDTLAAINPRLVYASISGFGEDGPYAKRPGFDQIAQGMGGLMWVTGTPGEGPMRAGIPVADLSSGLYCAFGVLAALLEREVSGKGQWVRTSLLQAMVAMMDFQAARWLMNEDVPGQAGNNHPTSIPTGVFKTADGHINIAASGDVIWERFCRALGREDWIDHQDYRSQGRRSRNRDALNAEIEAETRKRPSAEWIEVLTTAGVPCGPIYKMNEVFADPQVAHLRMARPVAHPEMGDISLVAQGVDMTRTPFRMRTAPPEAGEHTDEILTELGLDAARIAELRSRNVV